MFDTDAVLNLEEQFYQEGYNDGRQENLEHNLLEGRQYGLQVAFQRVHILGQIKSICEFIGTVSANPSLQTNCRTILEEIESLHFTNNDEDVTQFSKTIVKIKNKLRLILMVWNKSNPDSKIKYDSIFEINQKIAGNLVAYSEESMEQEASTTENTQDAKHDW